MLLAPHSSSLLFQLLRLAAGWVALVLLLQGLAAGAALVGGPRHTHSAPAHASLFQHQHHHDDAQQHVHAASDDSVVADAEQQALQDALDAAASALAAAFALLLGTGALRWRGQAGRVWRAAAAWPPLTAPTRPILKPPRGG